MEYCIKCGFSGDEIRLFDGIDINEPVKICERCAFLENIPLIKNPSTNQLRESERSGNVYNRLKKISGLGDDDKKRSFFEELKEIEANSKIPELTKEKPLRLVDNFHWKIQHHRRHLGMTHKQLAQAIGESEMAIKLIERNSLPEDSSKVLKKIEQYFRIKLIKPSLEEERKQKEFEKKQQQEVEKELEGVYEDLIFPKEESYIDLRAKKREEEDMVNEAIKTEPLGIRKYETVDKTHDQPMRVLDFKKNKLEKVTIADLQEIQRVIEQDFPKKSSFEIGQEQLESFGKETVAPDIAKKKWFNRYVEKKGHIPEKINSGQGLGTKVPSLQELAQRKRERDRDKEKQELVGRDIEILDEGEL